MFYILNNGGDTQYPTDGSLDSQLESEWYPKHISKLDRRGFNFYYNGENNHLVSYFKGYVGVPNQFYGVYYADPNVENIFTEFEQQVESAFEGQGWTTSRSGKGADSIYTHLTNTEPADLAVTDDELDRLLQNNSTTDVVQLGAADYRSALGVCKALVEYDNNIRVSICSSRIPDELPTSDVVVIPDKSQEPGEPIGKTQEKIEDENFSQLISEVKSQINTYIHTPKENSDQINRENALGAAIDGANKNSQIDLDPLGLRIKTEQQKHERVANYTQLSKFVGIFTGVCFSIIIAAYYGLLSIISETIVSPVVLPPPILAFEGGASVTLSSIYLVILCSGILFVGSVAVWKQFIPSNVLQGSSIVSSSLSKSLVEGKMSNDGVSVDSTQINHIIQDLDEILNHPAVDRLEDIDSVLAALFDETSIQVYDVEKLKQTTILNTLGWFAICLLIGTAVGVFTLGLLQFITNFWNAFIYILVSATLIQITVFSLLALVIVVRKVRSFITRTSSAHQLFPSWSDMTMGAILVAGAISTAQLGSDAWASREAITYHLVNGLIAKTLGQVVSVSVGVEIVFFAIVSSICLILLFQTFFDEGSILTKSLLISMSVGVILIWVNFPVIPVSRLAWIAGIVLGVVVGVVGGLFLLSERTPIAPKNVTKLVGIGLSSVLVIAFIEGSFVYQSPIVYDAATNQFNFVEFNFSGLSGGIAVGPIALTVYHFMVMCGVMYVIHGGVSSDEDIEVLVIGPKDSQPEEHVVTLFKHFLDGKGNPPEPKGDMESILNVDDSSQRRKDESNDRGHDLIRPIGFTTTYERNRSIRIWTPLTSGGIFGDDLLAKVDEVEGEKSIAESPEGVFDNINDAARSAIAESFHAADVLILLFPLQGVANTDINTGGMTNNNTSSKSYWYLTEYRRLLMKEAIEGKRIYGVVPDGIDMFTDQKKQDIESIQNRWEDLSVDMTDTAFGDCSTETRKIISKRLHNPNRQFLPIIKLNNQNLGLQQEIDCLSKSEIDEENKL